MAMFHAPASDCFPTDDPAEQLSDAAFAALFATDFERGQQLFTRLYDVAVRTQEVLLGLAICADQNDDDDTAARMLAEATALALQGRGPSPELYAAIRPWLPGGKLARVNAGALSIEARRFVSRLRLSDGPERGPRYT